jgi:hypothetical protein
MRRGIIASGYSKIASSQTDNRPHLILIKLTESYTYTYYSGGSIPLWKIARYYQPAYNRLTLVVVLRQVPGR